MIKIYGIKNCDTMQKAFKWLDAKKIAYEFHNYKTDGITQEQIHEWLRQIPIDTLVNTRSTTYKELSDKEKKAILDPKKCAEVIIQNPSVMKRPILDVDGIYMTGFSEEVWGKKVKG